VAGFWWAAQRSVFFVAQLFFVFLFFLKSSFPLANSRLVSWEWESWAAKEKDRSFTRLEGKGATGIWWARQQVLVRLRHFVLSIPVDATALQNLNLHILKIYPYTWREARGEREEDIRRIRSFQ
jgi:hypothetical protein